MPRYNDPLSGRFSDLFISLSRCEAHKFGVVLSARRQTKQKIGHKHLFL